MSKVDTKERFSADWLSLREPADHRSRSPLVLSQVRRWAVDHDLLRIIDLGCGSGSNLRYLCPRLSVRQHWVCVDQDPELIDRLTATLPSSPQLAGLSTRVDRLQTQGLLADIDSRTLVTASALLDLVSEDWLADLVAACHRSGAALLVAMTYDGRVEIHPENPSDGWILDRFDRDQRRDKGLGPALGPTAAQRLQALAEAQGFKVHQSRSDWLLDGDDRDLMTQLIEGWAEAVSRQAPSETDRIEAWHRQRRQDLVSRTLSIRVGHQDLFLEPSFPSRP
ncbi:class I SAM-dependent methyltransferase [Thiorhodococcus fuscus]|uniref:Class I SAM-dependent methyltransferase n=1 Tax=Thiorhodococcus fuscus TaxID=527200 RepID=A0ABW4Y3K8_9GAMM